MISVFLTEELGKHTARIDNTELAFFFCSAQDDRRNTAIAVLRGLVHQIIGKRPQLVKHALPHFETPERTQQTLSSLETLWLIFSKLVADAELGMMFCVVDGLDECEQSTLRGLLPRLVGLLAGGTPSSTHSTFKLAIVSRDMPSLRGCTTRVRLDPDNDKKVAGDIKLFVSARVAELSRIEGFNHDFRASVQAVLLARAEGTFLWVGFAMHELSQKETCSEILEALRDLPSGLPAIYSRMLLQIPVKRRAVSRAILHWVTLAVRSLQLRELASAIGLQVLLPLVTVEQATRDAIAVCGPLLKIRDQEVGFVHQSARDYLLEKDHGSDSVLEAFSFDPESKHLELTRKCLDCIAQSELRDRTINLGAEPMPGESPLLRYAVLHWPEHARNCSILVTDLFHSFGLFLQQHSPMRIHWWETYHAMKQGYRPIPPPLLHMACSLDIVPWVEAVLADNGRTPLDRAHWDVKDEGGQTALHWAVRGGSVLVIKLLLENGANIEAKDKDSMTALHLAALKGEEAVVRLLVDLGADIEAENKKNMTALREAIWRGNRVVVRLLVDLGADIEARDNDGRTALHLVASSWREKEAMVRLLVDLRVDIEARDNDGRTALFCAASKGEEAVVRLLVDLGADIKARDNNSETVLHSAASSWREKEAMVRLLVDRGADIEAKNKNNMTALHLAASKGKEAVVRLLVDLGADVEAKDKDNMTALHSAALNGEEAVVRLLVDRGADVKAMNKYRITVLHSAARGGNEAVVQLLVDLGADVEAKDKDNMTALHSAALNGEEAVVRLLVDLGADVEAKDKDNMTALHSAALNGEEAVVRLLVDRGADVKAMNKYGSTVLHLAARGGNEAVVRLLMDRGAGVKAKGNDRETAL
jgi:ankyrin repeat protein